LHAKLYMGSLSHIQRIYNPNNEPNLILYEETFSTTYCSIGFSNELGGRGA
jgi:hypothetical protein